MVMVPRPFILLGFVLATIGKSKLATYNNNQCMLVYKVVGQVKLAIALWLGNFFINCFTSSNYYNACMIMTHYDVESVSATCMCW